MQSFLKLLVDYEIQFFAFSVEQDNSANVC